MAHLPSLHPVGQPTSAHSVGAPASTSRQALASELASVLIVEDDKAIAALISRALVSAGYAVQLAETARQAEAVFAADPPGVVLLDLSLPDSHDLGLFHRIRSAAPRTRVVIMTAMDDLDVVINATRAGAFDFITKAPDVLQRVIVTVRNASESVVREDQLAALSSTLLRQGRHPRLISQATAMDDVKTSIDKLATSRVNVLITGQSGTGKEVVARTIHEHGPRTSQPFVAVNCAGIPDTLLESELFGYERGAFTGAMARKIGKFETAHGGTLFLDEIGEMSLSLQAKLLRVLQDGRFERLGGNTEIQADARVVCATNRDLQSMVRQGTFREDVYYRIAVFALHLPPLSERRGDIRLLTQHFLRQSARDESKDIESVAPEVLRLFEKHTWPGNVRQLQNVLARAAVVCATSQVALRDLPESFVQELTVAPKVDLGQSAATAAAHADTPPKGTAVGPFIGADQWARLTGGPVDDRLDTLLNMAFPGANLMPTVSDLEGAGVRLALRRCNGSMQAAADRLGVSRATLYRRAAREDSGVLRELVASEHPD